MTSRTYLERGAAGAAEAGRQAPTTGEPVSSFGGLFEIVTHPAFRLGFLDAQHGRAVDHDRIVDRIWAETPAGALRRLGYSAGALFTSGEVEIAQYRYEEGRIAVFQEGCRCKAWGHPDFPPTAIRKLISRLADERRGPAADVPEGAFIVAMLRGEPVPPVPREESAS